jgi:hypothetical protein
MQISGLYWKQKVMYSNENRIRERYVSLYYVHERARGLISYALRLLCSGCEIHKPTFMVNEEENLSLSLSFLRELFKSTLRLCMPHCSPRPFTVGVLSIQLVYLTTYYFRSASFWNFMQRGMVVCCRCFGTNFQSLLRG